MERLADEFTRLVGTLSQQQSSGFTSYKFVRPDDVVNSVLALNDDSQFKSIKPNESCLLDKSKRSNKSSSTAEGGWIRKIRGLLFVIVREFVRALDKLMENQNLVQSKGDSKVVEPVKGIQLLASGI